MAATHALHADAIKPVVKKRVGMQEKFHAEAIFNGSERMRQCKGWHNAQYMRGKCRSISCLSALLQNAIGTS